MGDGVPNFRTIVDGNTATMHQGPIKYDHTAGHGRDSEDFVVAIEEHEVSRPLTLPLTVRKANRDEHPAFGAVNVLVTPLSGCDAVDVDSTRAPLLTRQLIHERLQGDQGQEGALILRDGVNPLVIKV